MGTTADKLNKILTTKSEIRTSINNKGVTVPSDATFDSYPNYISQIGGGGIVPTGNKAITATTAVQTNIDVYNFATVSVSPTPSEEKTATDNGNITPTSGKLLSKVTVNIPYKIYRTGSGAPSSSLGNDGDFYIDMG